MSKGGSTRDKGGKEKEDREGKTASEARTCLGHLSEQWVGGSCRQLPVPRGIPRRVLFPEPPLKASSGCSLHPRPTTQMETARAPALLGLSYTVLIMPPLFLTPAMWAEKRVKLPFYREENWGSEQKLSGDELKGGLCASRVPFPEGGVERSPSWSSFLLPKYAAGKRQDDRGRPGKIGITLAVKNGDGIKRTHTHTHTLRHTCT